MLTERPRYDPPVLRTQIAEVVWPAIAAGDGARILALHFQLAQSEWWPVEHLRAQQMRQLGALVRHALDTVPYYRGVLPRGIVDAAGRLDPARWEDVPILTRAAVQQAGSQLVSGFLPRDHGGVTTVKSSGSTGRPVVVSRTGVEALFWHAFTLRDHLWHRRDLSAKLAAIRSPLGDKPMPSGGLPLDGWGASTDLVYRTGPGAALSIMTDIPAQAEWLLREDPDYLLSYPTNVQALAEHFERHGLALPRLREVRTVSEMVTPEIRAACRRAWNVPVTDAYSTMETGHIALQCPEHEHYHVQAEGVLVEILDARGRPCAPGEVGRVVLTPLHNFATVLLRYEVGDFAEAGAACPCGRGLPVIARIMGRVRNLVVLPDGCRRWPKPRQSRLREIAPLGQMQVVQRSLERIELVYTAGRELLEPEKEALAAALAESLEHRFAVSFTRVPAIARGAGGKFEDFVCEVAPIAR
jgi:phenylacetate-CoA ligase